MLAEDNKHGEQFEFSEFRLEPESFYLPNVAIGIRDMGGTGLFSGEYLVGSKKFGFLDLSMGIGWGMLATESNIRNPLISLDERLE